MNELSIWSLIWDATVPVQLVMLILVAASIGAWYVIFQRSMVLKQAKENNATFDDQFWSGIDLGQLFVQLENESGDQSYGQGNIFRAGFKEFARLKKSVPDDSDAIMTASERAMRVAINKEHQRLEWGLPFLATVGSASPYVGLFGTVWGIMHSFLSLANEQQASIATVAPGIAEALIATAIGLFAAIPAVVAFNRFATGVDSVVHSLHMFSEEFSAILHRKLQSERSHGGSE